MQGIMWDCHEKYIWTPPVCQDRFGCVGTDRLQFYIRPVVQVDCLLALMESADPRLILRKDSKSIQSYRLGGSRSDLFAITLSSILRNLYGGHSFSSG